MQARPFVTLSGQTLMSGQMPLHSNGSTMYPRWNYQGSIVKGARWAKPNFPQYIDHIIGLARAAALKRHSRDELF
jgi:hypothetical protein